MYEILIYNGTFYKFTEEESSGYPRTHILAGEVDFRFIKTDAVILIPLKNKWGFCMKTPITKVPDNWQVFDTQEECYQKSQEYYEKVVIPLNEDWERRKKSGEFNDLVLPDRQD